MDDYEGLSPEEIAAIKDDNEDNSKDDKNDGGDNKNDDRNEKDNSEDSALDSENKESKASEQDTSTETVQPDGGATENKDDIIPSDPDGKNEKADGDIATAEPVTPIEIETKLQEQKPFVPKFSTIGQEKLDSLKSEVDEAKKKFDDGEIDYATFSETKDKYNEASWKESFATESNKTLNEGRWQWEQERFLDQNVSLRDNKTLNGAFVSVVNEIIGTDEGKKLSDFAVLEKAKTQIEADLGIGVVGITSRAVSVADKKTDAEKQKAISLAKDKKSDRSNLSADIGGLPTAEENVDTSEFAQIENLSGEAYQKAIDGMTPAQLERYEDSM